MKQGAFNVCEQCGYKVVSRKHYENHLKTHVVEYPKEVVEEPKGEIVQEVPVAPVVDPEPLKPISDEITIRFIKPVEIQINGIHYDGKEIVVKNMSIASEIVRIAREAYGPTILA